ncbi:MAG: aminotransferase class V-fold PLP-dependent enzyme [Candidatus Saccharibacteria bacterium]|nr:aminotransferase class V-fold PLP-dependent enzyme [Candidatus Saccharibacteria bacterium]
MTSKEIYLDSAAGTPLSPSILKESLKLAKQYYYNPSALYQGARIASDLLVDYRRRLAQILGVKLNNLIFTGGATITNHWLFASIRRTYPQGQIVALNIDHDSLKLQADSLIPVDSKTGQIDLGILAQINSDVSCLSIAGINSELGIIQPFSKLKKILNDIRQKRQDCQSKLPLLLHVDASQMALTYNLQPQALADADFVTYNGGKFYAFRQSGLLYSKQSLKSPFGVPQNQLSDMPLTGNESLMTVSALTLALEMIAHKKSIQVRRLTKLQLWFEDQLVKLGGQIVLGKVKNRSPHITTAIFPNQDNETLVLRLSQSNIYVGIGSACHSQSDLFETSSLKFLGYSKAEIYSSLRFSFNYETTQQQLKVVIKKLAHILAE